jgi:hypothetical protein
MAKTVTEIKKSMTDVFIADAAVIQAYNLQPGKTFEDEFSVTSIESIIFYSVAYCAFVIYSFFDLFKTEINADIKSYTHPTLQFFADKIKTFQFGDTPIPGTDLYDNTGLTAAQIEAKRVIKYASAVEQNFSVGRFGVRLKVAGEDAGGTRVQLTAPQLTAAKAFMPRFKPGGVYMEMTSDDADYLKLNLKVYYNPLVLNNTGQRLDGTDNTPLQTAINNHLKSLPFNGRFNLTALVDAMQKVDGIADPRILSAQTKYALLPYTDVIDEVIPDAGYLKIYTANDLTIQWIAKNV